MAGRADRDRSPRSGAARSRAYREAFASRHGGISFNIAARLARAEGLKPGARVEAIRRAASTSRGVQLIERGRAPGASLRDQGLARSAEQAIALRSREFNARADIASGRRTVAGAERRYDLPPGTLRQAFTPAELSGRYEGAAVMQVIGADGVGLVVIGGQNDRELVGEHWRAVQLALEGRPGALQRFRGVEVGGIRLADDRDLAQLRAWAEAGLLDGGPYPEGRPS